MQKDNNASTPSTPWRRIRKRLTEVIPDASKANGNRLLVNDQSKCKSMLIRAYSGIWIIGGIIGQVWIIGGFAFIIYMGHLYIWAMVVVIQIFMGKELFSLLRKAHEDKQLPGFRILNWHFFFTAMLCIWPFSQSTASQHCDFRSILIQAGFMRSIMTLKKKMYKYQFGQFAWTHMILIVVFTQSAFTVANIFEGIF